MVIRENGGEQCSWAVEDPPGARKEEGRSSEVDGSDAEY